MNKPITYYNFCKMTLYGFVHIRSPNTNILIILIPSQQTHSIKIIHYVKQHIKQQRLVTTQIHYSTQLRYTRKQ